MLLLVILVPAILSAVAIAIPWNGVRPFLIPIAGISHLGLTIRILSEGEATAFDRWLALDPLNRLFLLVISFIFLLCALYAPGYLRVRTSRSNRVFCACVILFLGVTTLVCLSHHLGLMWVAIETTTLVTAPCIYFNHNARALEATWKYLLIGSVGIALALLGSFFLAYAMIEAGSESTLLFDELVEHSHKISHPWLHAAFILLVVGYGTKMGLAPMHTWKPDAYGEAPGMIGALLAGILTSVAFLCVLRFFHIAHIAHEDRFAQRILVFFGLISMATAAIFMARQKDIKRCLAYSSVEHMGMLAFGIGLGGMAVGGALLHVLHNGICKVALFLAAGNIHRAYMSKSTDEVTGVIRRLPVTGTVLLLGFFAITGSPLFGPFVSEYQILNGAFEAGRPLLGLTFLLFLLLVFLGMGNTLVNCAFGPAPEAGTTTPFSDRFSVVFPLVLAIGVTTLLGVWTPEPLPTWIAEAQQFLQRAPS